MSPPAPRRVGRVRGRRTFAALRREGTRRRSGPIVTTTLLDDRQPRACVAYAVPRAVGPAVIRNRLRRRLRAITRDLDLAPGLYLVSAAPPAAGLSYEQLAGHVRETCGA